MDHMQVQYSKDKKQVVITLDVSGPGNLSSSGKSYILATSHGTMHIPGTEGIFLGLNCFVKNQAYKQLPKGVASPLTQEQLAQARLVLAEQDKLDAAETLK